jgi:hypothetical protein
MFAVSSLHLLVLASVAYFVIASHVPASKHAQEIIDDVEYNVFEDAHTGITFRYVPNSGVCETTSGVKQHSGYANFGNDNVSDPLRCIATLVDAR